MDICSRVSPILGRLASLGGAKWELHSRARAQLAAGEDVVMLTIGEPDVRPPPELIEAAIAGMTSGRLGYSNGQGEPELLAALARKYSDRCQRDISTDQICAFPGTQTALFAVMLALLAEGDEVLVGDPMYATYEGIIRTSGAVPVPVPLSVDHDFAMQADDLARCITPRSKVIFLNTPHNPTGAVLSRANLRAIGALAKAHDLWIVCDEVYEQFVFDGAAFASPLEDAELAERVIVVSSISKSHAVPGFRSGWCVGPPEFIAALLPLAESMLFGNQPFIADMTALAVGAPSVLAADMRGQFQRRAQMVHTHLHGVSGLKVYMPKAGMFALVDVRATGMTGDEFADALLDQARVAVMPGESFGASLAGWVRVALTQNDAAMLKACGRMAAFAAGLQRKSA